MADVCDALAAAHAAGFVHRDLKPDNIFLVDQDDQHDFVKLLDFGISKMTSMPDAAVTRANDLMGSPVYMSPEQLRSPRDVDARADIWSIGVTLYELLSGKRPFDGETMPELVAILRAHEAKKRLPRSLEGSSSTRGRSRCTPCRCWRGRIAVRRLARRPK